MDSVTRARHIRDQMANVVGGRRNIYWDRESKCFRVMEDNSLSFYKYGRERFELVE